MKLLFDDGLSPRLVDLLHDLFPESESALRNGLSTDSDFERLMTRFPDASVVILRSCNYPTDVACEVLRRNAIRIAQLPDSQNRLISLTR
jgi:predicted nuclease of predicted toxin-antitoxin system